MSNISILQKAKKGDIRTEPFPYIVIENALDDSYYDQLESSYPSDEIIIAEGLTRAECRAKRFGRVETKVQQNYRYELSAVNSEVLPDIWKEFVKYHHSHAFYDECLDLFKDHIPHKRLKRLKKSETYARRCTSPENRKGMALDCQISINTPVEHLSTVRGPHIDHLSMFYAGLFYMRRDEDDSEGGNLEIFKITANHKHLKFDRSRRVKNTEVLEKVEEIPYQKNTFVMFLGSKKAIHGVSPRTVTKYSRRLVNVIAKSGM